MKKSRIYLDTSVLGGCFDEEFNSSSLFLFETFFQDKNIPLISELTLDEIEKAPEQVRKQTEDLKNAEMIIITGEMRTLAKCYLKEHIVSDNYDDDALHIAIATLSNADVLVRACPKVA